MCIPVFFCNNSKRAKWPTGDENLHNNGFEGFVHPAEPVYEDHLCRDGQGNIIAKTDIGKYMIKEMKLDLKRHAIIWNLELLESLIEQIRHELQTAGGKIPEALQGEIIKLLFNHLKYTKLLRKEGDA